MVIHEGLPWQGRLPRLRELAVEWNLSPVTVRMVLRILARKGLIYQVDGQRGFFTGVPQTTEPLREQGYLYERILHKIREQILNGDPALADVQITAKDISRQFACNYRTASKVAHALRGENLLGPNNVFVRKKAQGSRVYLATSPSILAHPVYSRFRSAIEQAVLSARWGELHFFLTDDPTKERLPPPEHLVTGYIYIRMAGSAGWNRFFAAQSSVPVVPISLSEPERDTEILKRYRKFPFLSFDNEYAGQGAAYHLSELGHTRIAFFTHLPGKKHFWVAGREAGLRKVFGNYSQKTPREISVFEGSVPEKLSSDLGEMRARLNRFRDDVRGLGLVPDEMAREHINRAYDLLTISETSRAMAPVFEKALRDSAITAWVCANDSLAACARSFLVQRGLKPGTDISLMGFDNTALSYLLNITSVDLGIEKAGVLAVRALVTPSKIPCDTRRIHRVDHTIIRRGSTQKPDARRSRR